MQRRFVGGLAAIVFLALAPVPPVGAVDPKAEATAMEVLDSFMKAFNARDILALERTLHFPHYRIASGGVSVLERAGTRPDAFDRFTASTPGWHHSAWKQRRVIHSGPSKVHVDTQFVRYREDGSVVATFDSIYIVTKQDGRWGIKGRSSFAP